MMADTLLTALCAICHVSTPKYTCPRCKIRTCSLPCIKKHKAWSECNGHRDATAYVPPRKLKTPAGIDHDYNFLSAMERSMDRSEKVLVEERELVSKRELRPITVQDIQCRRTKDGKAKRVLVTRTLQEPSYNDIGHEMKTRLREYNIRLCRAPIGMTRRRENKTRFTKRHKRIEWQLEWFLLRYPPPEEENTREATPRVMSVAMDDCTIIEAFGRCYDRLLLGPDAPPRSEKRAYQRGRRKRSAETVANAAEAEYLPSPEQLVQVSYGQDPDGAAWLTAPCLLQCALTTTWPNNSATLETHDVQSLAERFTFYLSWPRRSAGAPHVLVPIGPQDTLAQTLSDTTVFEYPAIYVSEQPDDLPPGYITGSNGFQDAPRRGRKRKTAPSRQANVKRKRRLRDLEEGEILTDGEEPEAARTGQGHESGEEEDGDGGGLEEGEVLAELSLPEVSDDDDDTSSSGSDSDSDRPRSRG